ncbi:hypothetical protein BDR26DRAFT_871183, partial [Obelidium mucronatum]
RTKICEYSICSYFQLKLIFLIHGSMMVFNANKRAMLLDYAIFQVLALPSFQVLSFVETPNLS